MIREYKGYQRIRIELGNRIHSALEQYGIPTRQGMQRLACHLTEYLDERVEKITPTLRETVLRSWKAGNVPWLTKRPPSADLKLKLLEMQTPSVS